MRRARRQLALEAVLEEAGTSDPAKLSEIEQKIIRLLDEEIRPALAMDGGDLIAPAVLPRVSAGARPVSPSTITKVGIPCTLYFFDSVAVSLRSAYGSASHGISAK